MEVSLILLSIIAGFRVITVLVFLNKVNFKFLGKLLMHLCNKIVVQIVFQVTIGRMAPSKIYYQNSHGQVCFNPI